MATLRKHSVYTKKQIADCDKALQLDPEACQYLQQSSRGAAKFALDDFEGGNILISVERSRLTQSIPMPTTIEDGRSFILAKLKSQTTMPRKRAVSMKQRLLILIKLFRLTRSIGVPIRIGGV